MNGTIHSLQSLGTVDGPGVRAVVFSTGCPLRCVYCHNPDTWCGKGEAVNSSALAARILRLYEYIKEGGVTFSGGEPCLQAEFFSSLAIELREKGLHIALDTSGCLLNEGVKKLLGLVDLVLLDIKFTSEEEYKHNTGGSLASTLAFLDYCEERGIAVWVRHVVVPGLNDNRTDLLKLKEIISPYSVVEKVELLPFRNLCIEKYEAAGIPFPLSDTPPMSESALKELSEGIF